MRKGDYIEIVFNFAKNIFVVIVNWPYANIFSIFISLNRAE